MANNSRFMDEWTGICCCHSSPTCIPMGGYIISGSPDVISGGQPVARLIEDTIGYCGHSGRVISASSTVIVNNRGSAKIGDSVNGCNIGTVISGNPQHDIGG